MAMWFPPSGPTNTYAAPVGTSASSTSRVDAALGQGRPHVCHIASDLPEQRRRRAPVHEL